MYEASSNLGTGSALATTGSGGPGAGPVLSGTYEVPSGCSTVSLGGSGFVSGSTTGMQGCWYPWQPYPYPAIQFQPWWQPVPYYVPMFPSLTSPMSQRAAAAIEVLKLVTDADDALRKAAVAVLLAEFGVAAKPEKRRRA